MATIGPLRAELVKIMTEYGMDVEAVLIGEVTSAKDESSLRMVQLP